jgi:hypothetical protein
MTAVYILLNLFWRWLDWIETPQIGSHGPSYHFHPPSAVRGSQPERPDERIKQESSPTRPPWAASRLRERRRLRHSSAVRVGASEAISAITGRPNVTERFLDLHGYPLSASRSEASRKPRHVSGRGPPGDAQVTSTETRAPSASR